MDKKMEIRRSLLRSDKLTSYNTAYQVNSKKIAGRAIQNTQEIKVLSRKEPELPQISSPFLKHTIANMFSHRKFSDNNRNIKEAVLSQNMQGKISNSKNDVSPTKDQYFSSQGQHASKRREIQLKVQEFTKEHLITKKTIKSFSLSKNQSQYPHICFVDLKKSIGIRQNGDRKIKSKSSKYSRANTQESRQSDQSPKIIFRKLQQLHQKETYASLQAKQLTSNKNAAKQLKSPGFVMRQKLSKEMYGQQRQQLKLISQLIANEKGLNMSQGIKVKNYTKFLPQIITIDD